MSAPPGEGGKRSGWLLSIAGCVIGFLAGHALGSRLSRGLLQTAIESSTAAVLSASAGSTVTALTIQAATAVLCAIIIPSIVVIALLHNERRTKEYDRLIEQRHPPPKPADGCGRDGRRSRTNGNRHPGPADTRRVGYRDSIRIGLEAGDQPEPRLKRSNRT
jgi:hypothetical protein